LRVVGVQDFHQTPEPSVFSTTQKLHGEFNISMVYCIFQSFLIQILRDKVPPRPQGQREEPPQQNEEVGW